MAFDEQRYFFLCSVLNVFVFPLVFFIGLKKYIRAEQFLSIKLSITGVSLKYEKLYAVFIKIKLYGRWTRVNENATKVDASKSKGLIE